MKKLIVISLMLMLTGCGKLDQAVAHFTGYSKICVDNVQYLQFTSGASVQYDAQGKVVHCE